MEQIQSTLVQSLAALPCITALLSVGGLLLMLWKIHRMSQALTATCAQVTLLRGDVQHRLDEFLQASRQAGVREGRAQRRAGELGAEG